MTSRRRLGRVKGSHGLERSRFLELERQRRLSQVDNYRGHVVVLCKANGLDDVGGAHDDVVVVVVGFVCLLLFFCAWFVVREEILRVKEEFQTKRSV